MFNGNPANPITPVCAITDASCSQTLLLQGIPYSFAWRTSDSDSWSDTNFRINLDWTPNDDTLMYFSVTTGYRAGGFALGVLDARTQSGDAGCLNLGFYVNCLKPVSYDAETVTAFEIGYKGTWLDGRAQVNASIYRYNYENYQDQIDSYDSARGASVDTVVNAGDATNQGFEVEATWLVGDYFTLGGNYSYTDTEYSESYLVTERNDLNLPNSLFQFALDENGNRIQTETGQNLFNLDAYVRDVQGNPLKRIPKQKATVYGSYEIPTVNGMPVCAITDASCSQTLLLQGIPYSFAWRTSDSDSWSDTNFRINLDWTPNDDTLMYFSVTTGYRAGGFALGVLDARTQSGDAGCLNLGFYVNCLKPVSYDAETVTAFEIGYKGTWLDGRAQVNASIYRYNYENYQDQIDSYDSARGASVDTVVNAGAATNQGFEVEATWLVGDYFTLGGNYSYTDTEYSESYLVTERNDLNLPNSLFQFALDENGNRIQTETGQNLFNLDAYVRDVQGNPLKRIPKQKATVYGSYEIPTVNGMLALNATYSYTGEYASSAFQRATDLVPSRKRVDLSVSWKDNADKWVARLFVDNVTDERAFRGIGIATESQNYRTTGERLYPRYWGFDVTRRFGG